MPTPVAEAPRLLTPGEVCAMLRVSRVTLISLVASGRIPVIRLGPKSARYRAEAIEAILAGDDSAPDRAWKSASRTG